ncbi:MAG: S1C family serine protease [Roseimicrobium sp.]
MLEQTRRILLVIAIFVFTGWLYKLWRTGQGGPGLFGTFEMESKTGNATLPSAPRLSETDVPLLAKLSEESAKLAATVLPSVVKINVEGLVPVRSWVGLFMEKQSSLGSGVIVSDEGHVITNFHVVANAQQGGIVTHDGKVHSVEVLGVNEDLDIAVLRIKGGAGKYPALKFADSDKARTGEIVFAVGNPLGLSNSVTQGIISATQRRTSDLMHDMIQTDTVINPGNSGGPLVNVRGEIVGINTAIEKADTRVNAWQGMGLAVPSNDVKGTFQAILSQSAKSAGFLGIKLEEQPVDVTAPGKKFIGCVVEYTVPGSPAEAAGLRKGDVIIQFDGRTFNEPVRLIHEMSLAHAGETKVLEIIRGDRRFSIPVTFGRRPKGP